MLILSTLIVATTVLMQEVKSADYSFNEDFNLSFSNETCRCKIKWHLINYNTINFSFTDSDYENKIVPMYSGCASLFGKDLLPNSALEINAYLLLTSSDNGLNVTVYDESQKSIKNYEYNRSSESLPSRWYIIKISVNKTIIGYYHFNETGQTIEIIKENNNKQKLKAESIQDVEKLWESDEIAKSEYLISYNIPKSGGNDFLSGEGSGDDNDEGDTALTPPGNVTDAPDTSPNSNFWKPWNITLVAVGSFTIVSIICVSAYHIGRRRSQEDNANIIEDPERPADIRIPRIHSIYSGFPDRYRRHI